MTQTQTAKHTLTFNGILNLVKWAEIVKQNIAQHHPRRSQINGKQFQMHWSKGVNELKPTNSNEWLNERKEEKKKKRKGRRKNTPKLESQKEKWYCEWRMNFFVVIWWLAKRINYWTIKSSNSQHTYSMQHIDWLLCVFRIFNIWFIKRWIENALALNNHYGGWKRSALIYRATILVQLNSLISGK